MRELVQWCTSVQYVSAVCILIHSVNVCAHVIYECEPTNGTLFVKIRFPFSFVYLIRSGKACLGTTKEQTVVGFLHAKMRGAICTLLVLAGAAFVVHAQGIGAVRDDAKRTAFLRRSFVMPLSFVNRTDAANLFMGL